MLVMKTNLCPLCNNSSELYFNDKLRNKLFYQCQTCKLTYLHHQHFLSAAEEKNIYLQHENNVQDLGYQKFVMPLVQFAFDNYTADSLGLDFGSGSGPVITHLLRLKNYPIDQYDPFFNPDKAYLEKKYDYILSCEVAEHFHHPHQEFSLLRGLLKPRGSLVLSTGLFLDELNFEKWHYHIDPTHVMFYKLETCNWIRDEFDFKSCQKISNRMVVFTAK